MSEVKRDDRWENVYARVETVKWYNNEETTEVLRFEIQVRVGGELLTNTRLMWKQDMEWLASDHLKINAFARQLNMMVEEMDRELDYEAARQMSIEIYKLEAERSSWLIRRNRHQTIPPYKWFGPNSDPGRDGCLCAGCDIANNVGSKVW